MYKIKFTFSALLTLIFAIVFYIGLSPTFNLGDTTLWMYIFCVACMFAAILFVMTYTENVRLPIYISFAIAIIAALVVILLSI